MHDGRGSDAFTEAASAAGFRLDQAQLVAVDRLIEAGDLIRAGHRPAPATYLWGPVGRGKTWLLDVFVRTMPFGWARRFHFHGFFRAFHDRLHHHGPGFASVGRALDDLIGDARVLCFDELYAHEPGDARLFTIILSELREARDLPMVVTSNYPPDGLMPDAEFATSGGTWGEPVVVRHQAFEAGIEVIKRTFDIVGVDGGLDYRTLDSTQHDSGFRSGAYVILTEDRPPARADAAVPVGTRTLRAMSAAGGAIAFDFVDLCDQPVGASDVAQLTARFQSWTIENVPRLSTCSPEAAQRFVNFVDVLCDADVQLIVTSRWPRRDLVSGRRLPPDIARVESRLSLLVEQDEPPRNAFVEGNRRP